MSVVTKKEQKLEKEASPRVKRLRQRVISAKPEVCSERARLITESYEETEGEPMPIRRAKALYKILQGISVYILEGELIVGHSASRQRSAPVFPEMDVEWLERELDTFETRPQDKFIVRDEVRRELREIFPYWRGKTIRERLFVSLPLETKRLRLEAGIFAVVAHEESGLGHVLLDYKKVLQKGFKGIIREIEEKMSRLNMNNPVDLRKYQYLKAMIISCQAAIVWGKRYAQEAERLAAKEICPQRKAELEKISEVCNWVPENPARTFHEALQSFWFTHLVPQLETDGVAITPGRFDQYMYPYYCHNIDNGVLTEEKAQELLDCLWVKFAEPVKLYNSEAASMLAGFPMGQNVNVGGTTQEGKDAVNELSYMCIKAHKHVRLYEPNFSIRVHEKISEDFLMRVCEAIRLGVGTPEVFNEEVAISSLLARGIPLKEARDYAPIGCVENSVIGMWMRSNGGYFCITKILELAINDGKCRLTGKQVGPQTGYLSEFKSFEEVMAAYKKQMEYFVKHLIIENNMIDLVHAELVPIPFVSTLVGGCIERGLDVTVGGANYNFTCPAAVGIADTGNCLTALKKLIYEDKVISPEELQKALEADFVGYEPLRLTLLNKAPKYGNDDDYVDYLTRKALDTFCDEVEKYDNPRGGKFVTGMTAITANIAFGRLVGATPDGRKAGTPLAPGVSPVDGQDRNGPTASGKSVAKLDQMRAMKGVIYNQKFSPSVLETPEELRKFANLIRTYFDLGGMHIQFNVVSSKTLRDAQKRPEKYQGLVVRVAGYSAFFNEVRKEVQDSIIKRTEFNNI